MPYADNEVAKAKKRAYYSDNKESIATGNKLKRESDPEYREKKLAASKQWRDKNKERQSHNTVTYRKSNKESLTIQELSRKYSVSKEVATSLYTRSMQTCDICNTQWDSEIHKYRFSVDHNHDTGEVRGVLCSPCNTALGLLKESTERILAMAAYNERYNGNHHQA